MADPLSIDVVSDVVCPWCYVGQKRLEQALALAPEIEVEVRWRPYQLDPSIPEGGHDRDSYMLAKFGSAERLRAAHERLAETGREVGIAFDFDPIRRAPNTLDAHRLIRWAAGAGDAGRQQQTVELLFSLYFEQGRDIGDRAVLIEAARKVGMDVALVETLLAAGADVEEVQSEIQTARRMGITGVPCFLLAGRYAVVGAQEPAALADALRQVAAAKERGELEPTEG